MLRVETVHVPNLDQLHAINGSDTCLNSSALVLDVDVSGEFLGTFQSIHGFAGNKGNQVGRTIFTYFENILFQSLKNIGGCNGFCCAVALVNGVSRHFAKTICVNLGTSVFSQEYSSDVGSAGSLIGLVHVHLVYEKLHVTVELQGVRLMGNGYIPTVPSTLTAMILIPRHRKSG